MIEKIVEIEGVRLYSRHMGSKNPIVIFESAMGNTLKNWLPVQTEIAKTNYTISYDRAGLGKSGKGNSVRNAENMAHELHEMLKKLSLEPPYVLAGASYGCFINRMFAWKYPGEVIGAVFVEPSHEDLFHKLRERHPDDYNNFERLWKLSVQMASEGYQKEWENFERDCEIIRNIPFPSILPVKIISSIRCSEREQVFMNLSEGDIKARCDLHKEWTKKNQNVSQIITGKSGHNVLDEEPELVTEVLKQLLFQL